MTLAAVRSDVASVLASVWPHTPFIADENVKEVPPPDGSAFLVIEFPFATEEPMSIGAPGANRTAEIGAVRFRLMVPVGTGSDPWRGWMEALGDVFRSRDIGDLHYGEADPPIFAPEPNGNYLPLSSAVAYRLDIYR